MPKPHLQSLVFSTINALLMLGLTLYWLSLPRTFGDEAIFIKWTSLAKKSLLGIDAKPPPGSVLYIDVSGAKMLVEKPDPLYEEKTGYHNQALTDRRQLAELLDSIAVHGRNIPVVIIDLVFEKPSPDDSLLQAVLDRFPYPLVGARRLLDNGALSPSVIKLNTGVANYLSTDSEFMKYPLFLKDTLPSLPLASLAAVSGKPYQSNWYGPLIDGKWSLPKPIIDFKIRPRDLSDGVDHLERPYDLRSMGTLLFEWTFWEASDVASLLEGKLIVIGDYTEDTHSTIFGSIPGPMIVHNAYLTLKEGESLIRLPWLLLLFALYAWMSRRIFLEEASGKRSRWWHMGDTAVGRIVADSIDDTFFLALGTILSYLVFNIHINILILLVYLKVVTYLLNKYYFRKPEHLTGAKG